MPPAPPSPCTPEAAWPGEGTHQIPFSVYTQDELHRRVIGHLTRRDIAVRYRGAAPVRETRRFVYGPNPPPSAVKLELSMRLQRPLLAASVSVLMLAGLNAAAAQTMRAGLPPDLASAGVSIAQWDGVRAEVRRQAQRARISERALLAAQLDDVSFEAGQVVRVA